MASPVWFRHTGTWTFTVTSGGDRHDRSDAPGGNTLRQSALIEEEADTMEAVRTGFVGCGAHATANLYPLLHEAGLDLAAVCDLDKRKAQRVCRLYGGRRCYQDLGNMIEEMDLDAALVCGPPEMHAEAISRALAHGIHVWSESPPAPTMAEAERLAEMAREHRLIVQVGLVMRFAPAYVRLKRSLEAEEFGQPVAVEAHLCTPRARSHEAHLMLECLNMLDLLRHLKQRGGGPRVLVFSMHEIFVIDIV